MPTEYFVHSKIAYGYVTVLAPAKSFHQERCLVIKYRRVRRKHPLSICSTSEDHGSSRQFTSISLLRCPLKNTYNKSGVQKILRTPADKTYAISLGNTVAIWRDGSGFLSPARVANITPYYYEVGSNGQLKNLASTAPE